MCMSVSLCKRFKGSLIKNYVRIRLDARREKKNRPKLCVVAAPPPYVSSRCTGIDHSMENCVRNVAQISCKKVFWLKIDKVNHGKSFETKSCEHGFVLVPTF